jgi:hypothetical protein
LLWGLGLALVVVAGVYLMVLATIVPGLLILLIVVGIFVGAVIATAVIGKVLQLVAEAFQRRR